MKHNNDSNNKGMNDYDIGKTTNKSKLKFFNKTFKNR